MIDQEGAACADAKQASNWARDEDKQKVPQGPPELVQISDYSAEAFRFACHKLSANEMIPSWKQLEWYARMPIDLTWSEKRGKQAWIWQDCYCVTKIGHSEEPQKFLLFESLKGNGKKPRKEGETYDCNDTALHLSRLDRLPQ